MVLYNARIDVDANVAKVERAIDRLERRLNRLRDKAASLSFGGVGGGSGEQQKLLPPARELNKFDQTTKAIADSAKRASTALKGLAAAGGILAGADAINVLGKTLEKASVSFDLFGVSVDAPIAVLNQLGANLREATAGIEPFVQALQGAGTSGLTTAAGIATATTAFAAFAPAIDAALEKLKISEKLFNLLAPAIKNTEVNFDGYIKKIRAATDTVAALRESQSIIRRELDQVNSSTEEAADTAEAYVRVTQRLNDELRAQGDLLRRARGFTVEDVATGEVRTFTQLEATKGRKSIETRQRAAEFRGEQYNRAVDVKNSWIEFFKQADEVATDLKQEADKALGDQYNRGVEVRKSWRKFFEEADKVAGELKQKAYNRGVEVKKSWSTFFEEADKLAGELKQKAYNRGQDVRRSWNTFLTEIAEIAEDLQAKARRVKVEKRLEQFRSENIARDRSKFLLGTSGPVQLGPLRGPGGAGFPVALPLTTAEEAVLQEKRRLAELNGLQKSLAKLAVVEAEARLDSARAAAKQKGEALAVLGVEREITTQRKLNRQLRVREGRARQKAVRRGLSEGFIGGAFPLLFGQGAGAAIGGGLGGFGGGLIGGQFGLGLSLAGTAFGSSFDALAEGARELGAALNPLTADINAITKASGLSGSKLEKLILGLEKAGDTAGALSLATEELEKVVGNRGVKALKEFSETSKILSNDFEIFLTRFKSFMAEVFNTLIVPPAEIELRKRGETIAAARESTDPNIQRAISQLDSASTIKERLALQEVILSLVEKEEAARRRELELQIASKGEAAEKKRELEASVAEKRIELEIELLNADANDETRVRLEKKLAFQKRLTAEQAFYNQYARGQITIDILRLELTKARITYETQIAAINNAAADAAERAAKEAKKATETKSKELSLQRDILKERLNLFNADEQMARVGLDRLGVLQREEQAILVRRNTEMELLEFSRQNALERNKVKGDEALINNLYDARLATIIKSAELAAKENAFAQERLRTEKQIEELRFRQSLTQATSDTRRSAEEQIRGTDPFRAFEFAGTGLGFFADSEQFQADRIASFNAQLERYNELIAAQQQIVAKGAAKGLDKDKQLGNKRELERLQKARADFELYQSQVDKAAISQARFNDALAAVSPGVNALVGGLQDIVAGTKTAQEVFANFLKTIADQLIQTAATMIAQYIAIGIAKAFAFGGGGGGFFGASSGLPSFGDYSGINLGGFGAFAEGGYVTGPTNALIGEGGEPEYVIPESKMRESMARYARGSRGSSVIPPEGGTGGNAQSGTAVAPRIDVSYTVERINEVDYVTAEEFRRGMQQAAQQGAAEGQQRTLYSLRQNTTQRRRIGI